MVAKLSDRHLGKRVLARDGSEVEHRLRSRYVSDIDDHVRLSV